MIDPGRTIQKSQSHTHRLRTAFAITYKSSSHSNTASLHFRQRILVALTITGDYPKLSPLMPQQYGITRSLI